MATSSPTKKTASRKPTKKTTTTKKATTEPEPLNPWDQQPKESGPAYEAFKEYRDLGLTRSLVKVAAEVGKSVPLMNRWSRTHQWAIRVQAWDRELDREWQQEAREMARKSAQRNARTGALAMQRVGQRLASLTDNELAPGMLAQLMDSASRLERLALGESTSNVQLTGANGGPIETADVGMLSDEERLMRMESLRRELEVRLAAKNQDQEAS